MLWCSQRGFLPVGCKDPAEKAEHIECQIVNRGLSFLTGKEAWCYDFFVVCPSNWYTMSRWFLLTKLKVTVVLKTGSIFMTKYGKGVFGVSCVDMCVKLLEKLSYFCYVKCLSSGQYLLYSAHIWISVYHLMVGSESCGFPMGIYHFVFVGFMLSNHLHKDPV